MISAVIPVYNEAECLARHVDILEPLLARESSAGWEIVLVDDGSTDATPEVVDQLAARHEGVRAVHHDVNRGKGAAVRTGILATKGSLVLFCDADMSTPPDTLAPFVAAMRAGADVVIGNRKSPEASIDTWQPPLRTWLGLRFTWFANTVLGLSISDYTCGFKLFRGDAAREILGATETLGWAFDVEILARAVHAGLNICEIPVHWHHEADTRVRIVRDVVRSFREVLAIRRSLGRAPRQPDQPRPG